MILVISGGGARGAYALGVLKALDELGISKNIKAIYGVSIGAIISSFYSAGYKPDSILDIFLNMNFFDLYKLNWKLNKSLLSNKNLEDLFIKYLPQSFEELKIKTYIGATDMNKISFEVFEKGELVKPLLGSMAIPGIFPPIKYDDKYLVDGGVLNNFPVSIAKEKYNNEKIIGISLNNVKIGEEPKNIYQTMIRTFEIMVNHTNIKGKKDVDILFDPNLEVNVFDINIKSMNSLFIKGYKECLSTLT